MLSSSRRIRPRTMPNELFALLLQLLAIQDAILSLLRLHSPRVPKLKDMLIGLIALVQRSA
eukprot:13462336-Heterocapsa_arctica.AAC.1